MLRAGGICGKMCLEIMNIEITHFCKWLGLQTIYFWGKTILFFLAISETIYYFQLWFEQMRKNLFISIFFSNIPHPRYQMVRPYVNKYGKNMIIPCDVHVHVYLYTCTNMINLYRNQSLEAHRLPIYGVICVSYNLKIVLIRTDPCVGDVFASALQLVWPKFGTSRNTACVVHVFYGWSYRLGIRGLIWADLNQF